MRILLSSVLAFCLQVSVLAVTIQVPADQPTVQAGIGAASNGDHRLLSGSPHIDAGNLDVQHNDVSGNRNDIGTLSYQPYFTITVEPGPNGTISPRDSEAVCATNCLRPWMFPDRWQDTDADGMWDAGEWYDPQLTGYTALGDIGTTVTLYYDNNPVTPRVGWFVPVRFGPVNRGGPDCTGADCYRDHIVDCEPQMVSPGDTMQLEAGILVGPTNQGVDALISMDPTAYYDPATNSIRGSAFAVSPRLIKIGVYDPSVGYVGYGGNSAKHVQVAKLVALFIERRSGSGVIVTRLMTLQDQGQACTGPQAGAFLYALRKTVTYGGSQTFTITPAAGYYTQDVAVDSLSVGAVDQYTFTDVTSDHTIRATFTGLPAVLDTVLVDGKLEASHVVTHTPTISWSYVDSLGSPQAAYELEVGTDTNWTLAEMWSTGPVSTQESAVTYAGSALSDGTVYCVRLRVSNDRAWSGWTSTFFRMNATPSALLPLRPSSNAVSVNLPVLWLHNAADTDGDTLTYEFSGFNDTDCVAGVPISLVGVPEGQDSTGGQVITPLAENCHYWWRARAYDGYEYSDWSPYATFWVNGTPEPPTAPSLTTPPTPDGKPLFAMLPLMQWTASFDADPLDTVRYKLELSTKPDFSIVLAKDSLFISNFTLDDSLEFGTHYYWRVTARDKTGLTVVSPVSDFWTWTLGDINHSHVVDLTDLSTMIAYLVGTGGVIDPKFVGDVAGSCIIDLTDLSVMIAFLTGAGGRFKVGCM